VLAVGAGALAEQAGGGESGGLSDADLLAREAEVVVPERMTHRVVAGAVRLEDHPRGLAAPAGAAGDLGEQREGDLAAAVVGEVEGGVGGDGSDQPPPGGVPALGAHTGADPAGGLA